MTNEKSKTGTKLSYSYLLVGGGIGAILALLFAPKTGQEFRADIADTTRKGLDKTKEIAGQLSEKANTVYEDTKTEAGEIYDSAKQKIKWSKFLQALKPAKRNITLKMKFQAIKQRQKQTNKRQKSILRTLFLVSKSLCA